MTPRPVAVRPDDDLPHPGSLAEEWVFAAWSPTADLGVVTGLRVGGASNWYWAALVGADRPLLHVVDWDVPPRSDPLLVKSPGLWAEHVCDAPFEQWTVANETYASALDEPHEALGRAYGVPTPVAMDLEWYAVAGIERDPTSDAGLVSYHQRGVVHGQIELVGGAAVELAEIPAIRFHRWVVAGGDPPALGPLPLGEAVAHTGLRAPFAFPDGSVADLVLTVEGFRHRARRGPT